VRTLYIENSVGRSVTDTFNKFRREHTWEAVFQHDRHPEMQDRQREGDAWWITEVTADGFVIVSCDLAIVENDAERQAVLDSGAQIIAFGKASYNRWDMMRGLCRHWLSIERHLAHRPLILRVWAGSKAPDKLL
jgi:PIN domain-containing protein